MTSILILFSILFGPSPLVDAHEFHVSNTTINYDTEEGAIQISARIFIDDLELALLEDMGQDSLKVCTRKEKENAESFIHEYLKQNLQIEIDGAKIDLSFLGKEQSDDLAAVWCYLEAFEVAPFEEISISNTILTTQFDDQKNITVVKVDKKRISHILFDSKHTSEKVEQ